MQQEFLWPSTSCMVVSNRKQYNRKFYFLISLNISCSSLLSVTSSHCDAFFQHVSSNKNQMRKRQQDKPTGTVFDLAGHLLGFKNTTTQGEVAGWHPFRALVFKPVQHFLPLSHLQSLSRSYQNVLYQGTLRSQCFGEPNQDVEGPVLSIFKQIWNHISQLARK